MLDRLIPIMLAFATAFVFTGQMEAAAAHCARLAQATEAAIDPVKTEKPPCHEEMAKQAEQPAHHSAPHHKLPSTDHCECIAALKVCAGVAAATTSTLIAPYAWAPPQTAFFVSAEPTPDWRPPRA